jgi:hypothetical protein
MCKLSFIHLVNTIIFFSLQFFSRLLTFASCVHYSASYISCVGTHHILHGIRSHKMLGTRHTNIFYFQVLKIEECKKSGILLFVILTSYN